MNKAEMSSNEESYTVEREMREKIRKYCCITWMSTDEQATPKKRKVSEQIRAAHLQDQRLTKEDTKLMGWNTSKDVRGPCCFPKTTRNEQVTIMRRRKDASERIEAMRLHEESTTRCFNYLTPEVNATHRRRAARWCFAVVEACGYSWDTVGVAMSILDRYLSSGNGHSSQALHCPTMYQVSAITSLYMAVKLRERSELRIELLVKNFCNGFCKESDIVGNELDILQALEWRVFISSTSPMEYVRLLINLLPQEYDGIDKHILRDALRRAKMAVSDIYFATCRASSVGMACLAGALDDEWSITSVDYMAIWTELSSKLDWDIASTEIRQVEKRLSLICGSSSCESSFLSHAFRPQGKGAHSNGHASSPSSVLQMISQNENCEAPVESSYEIHNSL